MEHTRPKHKIVCALSHLSTFFFSKIKIVEFLLVSIPNLKVSVYKFYSPLFSNSDTFFFFVLCFRFFTEIQIPKAFLPFFGGYGGIHNWPFIIRLEFRTFRVLWNGHIDRPFSLKILV